MKLSELKRHIKTITEQKLNELHYSSGDIGLEYDPYDEIANDLSVYDELSNDDIARFDSEDEFNKAVDDEKYMNDVSKKADDYYNHIAMDESKIQKKVMEKLFKKLKSING